MAIKIPNENAQKKIIASELDVSQNSKLTKTSLEFCKVKTTTRSSKIIAKMSKVVFFIYKYIFRNLTKMNFLLSNNYRGCFLFTKTIFSVILACFFPFYFSSH